MQLITWEDLAACPVAQEEVTKALRPGITHHCEMAVCVGISEQQAFDGMVRLAERELAGEVISCIPFAYQLG